MESDESKRNRKINTKKLEIEGKKLLVDKRNKIFTSALNKDSSQYPLQMYSNNNTTLNLISNSNKNLSTYPNNVLNNDRIQDNNKNDKIKLNSNSLSLNLNSKPCYNYIPNNELANLNNSIFLNSRANTNNDNLANMNNEAIVIHSKYDNNKNTSKQPLPLLNDNMHNNLVNDTDNHNNIIIKNPPIKARDITNKLDNDIETDLYKNLKKPYCLEKDKNLDEADKEFKKNSNNNYNKPNNKKADNNNISSYNSNHLENKNELDTINYRIRMGFIRKVYGIVVFQMIITFLISCLSFIPEIRLFFLVNYYIAFIGIFFVLLVFFILAFKKEASKKVPLNYILLACFTFSISIILLCLCAIYTVEQVLVAWSGTIIMSLTIILLSFCFKVKFHILFAIILITVAALFFFGLVIFFSQVIFKKDPSFAYSIFCSIGALLYGLYLVFHTQMLINNKMEIDTDKYICTSLQIYMDIILIFLHLLGTRR